MSYDAVAFDREQNELVILDQTLLPGEERLLRLTDIGDICEAICSLRVRGAPAIGAAAAIAMAVAGGAAGDMPPADFRERMFLARDCLASTRPTAFDLFRALGEMADVLDTPGAGTAQLKKMLAGKAEEYIARSVDACRRIGENALTLLRDGDTLLTHCNAGRLAAVRYGTALAPVYVGAERGYRFKVYADETRPLLQGARLTAWELADAGIETVLICDSMASAVMAAGKIDAVVVGADTIAANGDTANKIGTSAVAVLARHYGVPFYVCAPSTTVNPDCPDGAAITIEQRAAREITALWYAKPMAPESVTVFNPAFDITPAALITAIITENAVYPNNGGEFFGNSQTV